jgi:DNA-binding LacI/PurR family transcriptional regulator
MQRSEPARAGPRACVALLVDSFDAAYQAALVRFVRQACERRGLRLVVFPGGVIGGTSLSAEQRNRVYDLISPASCDGLIVLAGTMTREVGVEVLSQFCRRFRPLPMCSIGFQPDGIPSYLVDNAGGMRSLVRHLVQDHGYRRLAFVAGPPAHEEANERLVAFRDELRRLGIEQRPEHVLHGDFMPGSGQLALDALLGRAGAPPEAIIAANDAMAMGILEALTRHPTELAIAVCGFDNVVETDFCSPPLTTVEQPLQRLAEEAVAGLVAQLTGGTCPAVTRLETRPVLRRSCGCDASRAAAPEMQRRMASRGNSVLEFIRHREEILAQLSLASGDVYAALPRWRERLLDSFAEQIRGAPAADFLACVRDLLRHTLLEGHGETWRFHNVLSAMRVHALPCVAGDLQQWARAEDLLQSARTLTGEAVLRGQARRLLSADQQHLSMNYVGGQLSEVRDERELAGVLRGATRELGIRRLAVVEFLVPDGTQSRVRAAIDELAKLPAPAAGTSLGRARLMPNDAWLDGAVQSWVVLPLFYQREPLGYLLAELCLYDAKAYESLRVHLSAALWALRRAGEPRAV